MNRIDLGRLARSAFVLALVAGGYAMSACGSNSSTEGGGDAGFGFGGAFDSLDGSLGTGGAPFDTGGSANGGNSAGGAGAGGVAVGGSGATTAQTGDGGPGADAGACVVPTTLIDATIFPACDQTKFPGCTNARCVPKAVVPASAQALLGACDDANLCVPSYFVERNAKFIAPTCTSVNGAEGRCLSQCIPQIANQANFLPKDVCGDGDLCAPCFDPRTGADTSACTEGCDTGPKEPAKPFAKCCSGTGSCVPKSIVPTADLTLLGADTCKGADDLCAPDKLSDSTYIPKTCKSLGDAEGRCLASCIPEIAAQKDRLPKDVCDTGELCAPCFDPLTGDDTGACKQNGDSPKDPPVTFDTCCSDQGHCVPKSILSTAQQGQLGVDTCKDAKDLCAPDVFAEAGQKAPTCRALGGLNAEGRCIPSCVPSVASQKDRLDQGTPKVCAAGTLCAPCYDPSTGADTGACSQNGDAPKEAKKTFPTCCSDAGSCVPKTLVPASELPELGQDTCSDSNAVCAPKKFIDPTVKPASCLFAGNIEARCLPACLPPLQAQKAQLSQGTCDTGELCAPCYNPLDGTDTGACKINGDAPKDPPVKFDACCTGGATDADKGTCVPPALAGAAASSLQAETCKTTGYVCAPNVKAKPEDGPPKKCTYGTAALQCYPPIFNGGCDGVCLPSCELATSTASLLAKQDCGTGEVCVPCADPLHNGAPTGACDN